MLVAIGSSASEYDAWNDTAEERSEYDNFLDDIEQAFENHQGNQEEIEEELEDAWDSAVKAHNINVMGQLLDRGADINARVDRETTALMLYAQQNFLQGVRFLLSRGAAVNLVDEIGSTALLLALEWYSLDVARELLNISNIDVDRQNGQGYSPLMIAASGNHFDIFDKLIEKTRILI